MALEVAASTEEKPIRSRQENCKPSSKSGGIVVFVDLAKIILRLLIILVVDFEEVIVQEQEGLLLPIPLFLDSIVMTKKSGDFLL